MNKIWLAIITDVDDGRIYVNGVFDNEASARECVDDDFLASNALVYRIELDNIKSSYIRF